LSLPPLHLYSLHSFPTRRSSDLKPYNELLHLPFHNLLFLNCLYNKESAQKRQVLLLSTLHSSSSIVLEWKFYVLISHLLLLLYLDRKSTRLNSSHVSISYAVFCL